MCLLSCSVDWLWIPLLSWSCLEGRWGLGFRVLGVANCGVERFAEWLLLAPLDSKSHASRKTQEHLESRVANEPTVHRSESLRPATQNAEISYIYSS